MPSTSFVRASTDKLWNLYGNVDWMNGAQLNATFNALSPAKMVGETELLQDRQSRQLFGNVSDRLSLLGTGQASRHELQRGRKPADTGRAIRFSAGDLGLTSGGRSFAAPMGAA